MEPVVPASIAIVLFAALSVVPLWLQRRVRQRIAAMGDATPPVAFVPPPGPDVPPPPPVPGPAVPLHDLLTGMTLPCELAPLTNVEPAGFERLVFVTDWPAHRVRADLKGALAAIDFDLCWTGASDGVATRDAARFRVLVHASPEAVLVGTRPAFPTAGSGTTVVELAAA